MSTTLSSLQRRRPRDDSAAALREALEGLQEDRAEADHAIRNETTRRGELLRTGTEKSIRASEDTVSAARLQLERIGVMTQDLTVQLAQAEATEAAAAWAVQAEEVRNACVAFNVAFDKRYEHAVQIVDELNGLEAQAQRLYWMLPPRPPGAPSVELPELRRLKSNDGRSCGFSFVLPRLPRPGASFADQARAQEASLPRKASIVPADPNNLTCPGC